MCSKKQKGYTTAQKMIHRFAFELSASYCKKNEKEKKKGETQTRVEPVPLRTGGNTRK